MPAYEIEIEGRKYAGHYHTQANAVFGVMRFRENELHKETRAGLDLSLTGRGHPLSNDGPTSPSDWDIYRNRRASVQALLSQTTRIVVRPAAAKTPKKVHRVHA